MFNIGQEYKAVRYEDARSAFHRCWFFASRASTNARKALKERNQQDFEACMAVFRVYAKRAKYYRSVMQLHDPPPPQVFDVAVEEDYRYTTPKLLRESN